MVNRVLLLLPVLALISCQHAPSTLKTFSVRGTIVEFKPQNKTAVIRHERIPGYMNAMTMPFNVRDTNELAQLEPGDQIDFRLNVTDNESWIDHITKTGRDAAPVLHSPAARGTEDGPSASTPSPSAALTTNTPVPPSGAHPLMTYAFTNQFGEPVTLADFRGQALAITFFFTRCPIPDYCPRLSKNFEEASTKLASMSDAPTNWHFISVTIDPKFDTPLVLAAYAKRYHADPKHWTFLTGPSDKIADLARESGVTFEPEKGFFNHNFRTLIIDPVGKLQMSFPVSGNISDGIVTELLKAASAGKS
jgi:protein SCO1/2